MEYKAKYWAMLSRRLGFHQHRLEEHYQERLPYMSISELEVSVNMSVFCDFLCKIKFKARI